MKLGTTKKNEPTILLVEDEAALRADVVEELNEAGYHAIEAASGEEAIACCAGARPDLVLCDINMPGMSGYEVLEALRTHHPELAGTPFIFLTAFAAPSDVVEGKRAGADDYLVKPIDYDLMLATIEARLREVDRIQTLGPRDASAHIFGASHQALDRLGAGIVLLDRNARVLFANRAAQAVAAERDGFEIGETLRADGAQNNGALNKALVAATGAGSDAVQGHGSLSLPRPSGKRDLMVVVVPLDQGDAAAALFISDPERRPVLSAQMLSALFDLTETEAEIAIALVGGARPGDIAQARGVTQTTIAFHMRNLFDKTGVSRQADLIALILASPLSLAQESGLSLSHAKS